MNLKGNLLEKKDVEAMAAGMKKGMWRRLKRLGQTPFLVFPCDAWVPVLTARGDSRLASHRIDAADREQLKIQVRVIACTGVCCAGLTSCIMLPGCAGPDQIALCGAPAP